jgi:hypothetical protein
MSFATFLPQILQCTWLLGRTSASARSLFARQAGSIAGDIDGADQSSIQQRLALSGRNDLLACH